MRRTVVWRERYKLVWAAGLIITVSASLLLCGLFTLSFTTNRLALSPSRLDLAACVDIAGAPAPRTIGETLGTLNGCRETIETLIPRSVYDFTASFFSKDGV